MNKYKNYLKLSINYMFIFTLAYFCLNTCFADIEANYINDIDQKLKSQEYREAVKLMNKYELSIISQFPKPSYSGGVFKCSKTGLSFNSSFGNWKPMSEEDLEIDRTQLLQAGCDVLLMLEEPEEKKQFMLFNLDMRGTLRGMFSEADAEMAFNDINMIKNQSIQLGSFFGAVADIKSRKMNDFDLITQEIADIVGEPKTAIYIVHKKGQFFIFLIKEETDEIQEFKNDVMHLMKTVQVESFKQKTFTKNSDIISDLNQVSTLEKKGELHDALELLKDVRDMAKSKMPKALKQGNKCIFPSYGVSIKNPDSNKFKLDMDNSTPGMSMAFLQEKYSVNEEGILVMILDLALSYPPAYLESVKKDDQVKRDMLIGAGRGGCMNTGELVQEKLIPFGEVTAYEGIVKMAAMNNMKARILVVPSRDFDYAVMIMNINSSYGFDKKLEEYDKIIKSSVVISE